MSAPIRMACALAIVLALAGCGTTPGDAVRTKVQQFASATRNHDYKTICTQVLAPDLTARLSTTGVTCEQAMQIALGSVRKPALSIGKVTVTGSTAAVIVLTVAQGQQASLSTIGLTRTGGGWRIASLQEPAPRSG
jgi:hypothetical protein